MKQRINNWTKLLYGFLMTILGFSGCDAVINIIEPRMEYGSPFAEFKIVGEVKSTDGKPIKGIRVIVNPRYNEQEEYASWEQDTLFTDANGYFSKDRLKYTRPDELKDAVISFEDVDGPENGGDFEYTSLRASGFTVEKVKKGSGTWDNGDYLVTANATMSPKKQD